MTGIGMTSLPPLPSLQGYPAELQAQAAALLEAGTLGEMLAAKYPVGHNIHSNKQLFSYVQELKARHLKRAAPLAKVSFDSKLSSVHNALGLHMTSSKLQGSKVQKKREIRIASVFKTAAGDFLRMIVVHELAHMKHQDHSADFYKLCCHMEPEYHQLEFDFRLYLCTIRQDLIEPTDTSETPESID